MGVGEEAQGRASCPQRNAPQGRKTQISGPESRGWLRGDRTVGQAPRGPGGIRAGFLEEVGLSGWIEEVRKEGRGSQLPGQRHEDKPVTPV